MILCEESIDFYNGYFNNDFFKSVAVKPFLHNVNVTIATCAVSDYKAYNKLGLRQNRYIIIFLVNICK